MNPPISDIEYSPLSTTFGNRVTETIPLLAAAALASDMKGSNIVTP